MIFNGPQQRPHIESADVDAELRTVNGLDRQDLLSSGSEQAVTRNVAVGDNVLHSERGAKRHFVCPRINVEVPVHCHEREPARKNGRRSNLGSERHAG